MDRPTDVLFEIRHLGLPIGFALYDGSKYENVHLAMKGIDAHWKNFMSNSEHGYDNFIKYLCSHDDFIPWTERDVVTLDYWTDFKED